MSTCTLIIAIVFSCFIVFSSSLVVDVCNQDDVFSSENAYAYVAKTYGIKSNTTYEKELYSFLKNLGFFRLDAETLNCSILNYLANLNNSNEHINSTNFSYICANILALLDQHGFQFHKNMINQTTKNLSIKPDASAIWGFGVLAVTIISLCSLVGISLLPLMKKEIYDKILLYLIALAVGTLSSNAIFQLIPEGFGIDSDPLTVWQSAVIFGGFYIFYLTENVLERIFNTSHNHAKVELSFDTSSNVAIKVDPRSFF